MFFEDFKVGMKWELDRPIEITRETVSYTHLDVYKRQIYNLLYI